MKESGVGAVNLSLQSPQIRPLPSPKEECSTSSLCNAVNRSCEHACLLLRGCPCVHVCTCAYVHMYGLPLSESTELVQVHTHARAQTQTHGHKNPRRKPGRTHVLYTQTRPPRLGSALRQLAVLRSAPRAGRERNDGRAWKSGEEEKERESKRGRNPSLCRNAGLFLPRRGWCRGWKGERERHGCGLLQLWIHLIRARERARLMRI